MPDGFIKVLVADDHDLIRQGIRRIIEHEEHIQVVGEACNGEEVLAMIGIYQPDVLLMDMNMPILNGLDVLKTLNERESKIKTIILTIEDDREIIKEVIGIGADGYVLKDSAGKEVVEAINRVVEDDKFIDKSLVHLFFTNIHEREHRVTYVFDQLSNREIDVLYYISKGYSNREIAEVLYLSEHTVKNYITKAFKHLEVKDRVHATIFALENDLETFYEERKKEQG